MAMTIVDTSFPQILQQYNNRAVIMIEQSAEGYFEKNIETIKLLIDNGFKGIYISFQRPFMNVYSMFKRYDIDTSKLLFIDAAAALSGEKQEENDRCIHISGEIDIDEIVRAIYTALPRLQSKKTFIFIDSLTTIALYKPLSETMRFSEFLVSLVRKEEQQQTSLIFNVAEDLAQKKFIQEVAFRVDEVIRV
ncbi:MAG TPA: hypothetical protein ENG62_02155 [Thermoplasmatales archaeon]|nr:hypothetical protein [Thermoplasmatales archaeon]